MAFKMILKSSNEIIFWFPVTKILFSCFKFKEPYSKTVPSSLW